MTDRDEKNDTLDLDNLERRMRAGMKLPSFEESLELIALARKGQRAEVLKFEERMNRLDAIAERYEREMRKAVALLHTALSWPDEPYDPPNEADVAQAYRVLQAALAKE